MNFLADSIRSLLRANIKQDKLIWAPSSSTNNISLVRIFLRISEMWEVVKKQQQRTLGFSTTKFDAMEQQIQKMVSCFRLKTSPQQCFVIDFQTLNTEMTNFLANLRDEISALQISAALENQIRADSSTTLLFGASLFFRCAGWGKVSVLTGIFAACTAVEGFNRKTRLRELVILQVASVGLWNELNLLSCCTSND